MPLIPTNDVAWPVSLNEPANCRHPLNRGCVAWWLSLPDWYGGRQWFDLMGLWHGTFNNSSVGAAQYGWRGTTRPGGWAHLLFDGGTNAAYASLMSSTAPPINLAAGQSASLACWFKVPSGTLNYPFLVGCGNDSPGQGFGLQQSPAGDQNLVYLVLNDSANTGGVAARPAVNTGTDNAWHRALGVIDRANAQLCLYLDGQPASTVTIAANGGTVTPSSPFQAGRRGTGVTGNQCLLGSVDDCKLWLRALSASDAWSDYENGPRGYPGTLTRLAPGPAVAPAIGPRASAHYRRRRAG